MNPSKPQDFDRQAIPHYNSGGRLGELDRDEPEERESSVQSETGTELPPENEAEGLRTVRDDRARGVGHDNDDNPEPAAHRHGRADEV